MVLVDEDRFISPLVKMANSPMAAVVRRRIADVKMPHEFGKIPLRSLHNQMKVIAQQYVAVDPNLVNPNGYLQLIEKSRPIAAVAKNVLSFIAAAGDVIKSSGIVYPQWARHDGVSKPKEI